jgi:hypothetical protein
MAIGFSWVRRLLGGFNRTQPSQFKGLPSTFEEMAQARVALSGQLESEPLFTRLLYVVQSLNVLTLLVSAFVLTLGFATCFGAISLALGCLDDHPEHEYGLFHYLVLSLGDLIGNHSEWTQRPSKPLCNLSVSCAAYLGLAGQALFFGIFVHRVIRPPHHLVWADKAVLQPRNGLLMLRFRLMHKFGRGMVNTHVRLYYRRWCTSSEGERYLNNVELDVHPQGQWLLFPQTISHTLDEHSPLYGLFDAEPLPRAGSLAQGSNDVTSASEDANDSAAQRWAQGSTRAPQSSSDCPITGEKDVAVKWQSRYTLERIKQLDPSPLHGFVIWAQSENPRIGGHVDCWKAFHFAAGDVVIGSLPDVIERSQHGGPAHIDFARFKQGYKEAASHTDTQ